MATRNLEACHQCGTIIPRMLLMMYVLTLLIFIILKHVTNADQIDGKKNFAEKLTNKWF